ncbi:MAG: putative RDD family membrane protein YckC [Limisphaerales bacterium]|jgi:uncharacterized RDD family membrane protein YckC
MLDMMMLYVSSLILLFIFRAFGSARWLYFIPILYFFCYTLIFELILNGQTPGKKIMGLKVIKLTGKEASLGDYMVRWLTRLIDIIGSLTSIGAMMIATSPYAQRIGGMLSDTIVVRIVPRTNVALGQLLKMHQDSAENIEFESVVNYSEDDMLMAMTVLDRHRRYPNEVNRDILYKLVQTLKKGLHVSAKSYSDEKFIRKVIRDYVALTR